MTDAPPTLDLDGLSELLAKATPGPWRLYDNSLGIGVTPVDELESDVCSCPQFTGYREREGNQANAALIVALRNNGEALIAEVRRLREEVAEAHDLLRRAIVAAGGVAHPDCSMELLRWVQAEVEAIVAAKKAAEAQRDEAREALRPFSEAADWIVRGDYPDESRPDRTMAPTYGDYRRARAIIEGSKP